MQQSYNSSYDKQGLNAQIIWKELMDLLYQEIICWRMYGIIVEVGDDWILVDVRSQFNNRRNENGNS